MLNRTTPRILREASVQRTHYSDEIKLKVSNYILMVSCSWNEYAAGKTVSGFLATTSYIYNRVIRAFR